MYHNDPGLAYLKKINFQRIKGKWGLLDRWKRDFGSQRGEQIWKEYNDFVNKNKAGEPDFYKFKSSHPLISKGLIEWYDADIIRKACNYIDSHKELFGKNILEVGCDNGNITGFLAITFPESKIVAIDRCEEAVAIAQEKMAALGINNVEFRACDVFDVEEKFDTVLAMRTLHENMIDLGCFYTFLRRIQRLLYPYRKQYIRPFYFPFFGHGVFDQHGPCLVP